MVTEKYVEPTPPPLSSYIEPDCPVYLVAASAMEEALRRIYAPELIVTCFYFNGRIARPWWATLGYDGDHCRLELRIDEEDEAYDWVWHIVETDGMVMQPNRTVKTASVTDDGFDMFRDSKCCKSAVDMGDRGFFRKALALLTREVDWQLRRESEKMRQEIVRTSSARARCWDLYDRREVLERNRVSFRERAKKVRI